MANTTFMGLDIATRGLFASQRGLATVNHNINNVNTPGYSRQEVIQKASRPMLVADGSGMLGMGADVVSVERIRDKYLDFKYWSEHEALGEWEVKMNLMEDMQATFNEPSDSGFNVIMDDFYSSLQQLATDPSSPSNRAMIREKGVMVAKYFNSVAIHMEHLQESTNQMVHVKVSEVNSLADQITQLNKQIYSYELNGNNANDLRDERIYLVDKLSKIVNVEAYEVKYGKLPSGCDEMHFVVNISGKGLVDHFNNTHLEVEQRATKLNPEDIDNLYHIKWEDGNKIDIKSGELRGYLDIRDGNESENSSPEFRGIPYYQRKLNEFVRVFARTFNEGIIDDDGDGVETDLVGHVDGYTLDSVVGDPPSGIRFFTMKDSDGNYMDSTTFINGAVGIPAIEAEYEKLTAKNFCVGAEIISDAANNICTSSQPEEVGNIDTLREIIKMRHNPYMFMEGAPEDFIKTLISGMGVDGQQSAMIGNTQNAILKQVENRRLSTSGVAINEEMTNLVKYQHSYNAAAKMVQTYQEILDILINRLGL